MSYTAPQFWLLLFATLAAVLLAPQRARLWVLIAASLAFYGLPDATWLLWLAGVFAVVFAGASAGPTAARLGAGALVIALVGVKFGDGAGLPLPAEPPGFSFLAFTAIAYLIDVARDPARRVLPPALLLHLAWFPKLLAGPIERSAALVPQFSGLAMRPGLAALGFSLILSGLVKKLVIADTLAPLVDAAYAIPDYAAPFELLLASYFFAFQIYCDFSGYSDLALGLSALVGLRLSQNFDRPYLAVSVTEFWSDRWHITLGRWFRDYVYIPLGGGRHGPARRILNLMTVFALSGLWHAGLGYGVGWGFLVWGLLNGAVVSVEALLPPARPGLLRPLGALLTFHLILVTWVFFRAATVEDALTILRRIAGGLAELPAVLAAYPFTAAQITGTGLVVALLAAEIALRGRPFAERLADAPVALRWAAWYGALALLLLFGRWQGEGFIYARF